LLTAGTTGRFEIGARAVGAVDHVSFGTGLPEAGALHRLFSKAQGKRLVGLMPDAAYVLFSEVARDAGVVQMLEGRHMIAVGGSGNHALYSSPGFHGTAEMLAATLMPNTAFAITEAPLGGISRPLAGVDWSSLGFASYRLAGHLPQDEIWLHLAGLDIGQGCEALGIDSVRAEALRCRRSAAPPDRLASQDWEPALGQALALLAAGGLSNSAPCVKQAFIHQLFPYQEGSVQDSFVSFVMEA
jgi:hypothetical protein